MSPKKTINRKYSWKTPYRNEQMLKDLTDHCRNDTQLCIARNITGENELIKTLPIIEWKKNRPDLNKHPTVFVMYNGNEF